MGWWSKTKSAARTVGRGVKSQAGKIARGTAVAAAGVGGSLVPVCGPVCGFVAAAAVDELLGERIERTARRAIDKSGAAADDFVDYLRGGQKAARPSGMATTVEGIAAPTTLEGDAAADTGQVSRLVAIAAGGFAVAAVTLLVLKRTGKL